MLIDVQPNARHTKTLLDFVQHCNEHPTERFWQALLNWSGKNFILFSNEPAYTNVARSEMIDTFYLEGKS
jgi:hypothetical protein